MKLRVTNKMTIAELQSQFSAEFPYLKIEFFDMPYLPKNRLSKSHIYSSNKTLGTCRRNDKEGVIEINGTDTVENLEKIFWNEYGLSAEIFRKSGSLWIETSLSNSWTLNLQNQEGKTFSEWTYKKEDEDK